MINLKLAVVMDTPIHLCSFFILLGELLYSSIFFLSIAFGVPNYV